MTSCIYFFLLHENRSRTYTDLLLRCHKSSLRHWLRQWNIHLSDYNSQANCEFLLYKSHNGFTERTRRNSNAANGGAGGSAHYRQCQKLYA